MKKRFIAILCVLLVIIAGAGGYVLWCYNNPEVTLSKSGNLAGQNDDVVPVQVFEWVTVLRRNKNPVSLAAYGA